jgi:flavin-dependent dehydrogenase
MSKGELTCERSTYDVLICGAGLAGLTLARQLKLELPQLKLAIIDSLSTPLPEAAHKVGESSNELQVHYFGKMLGLQEHLLKRQLIKFSLRYFFGDSQGPLEDRPELGVKVSPPLVTGFQLDRGRLENDLRRMAQEMGVVLFEGSIVDNIVLSDGEEPHAVLCRNRETTESQTLFGRWVVDALGRRRFLQSRLRLMQPNGHLVSASWWRLEGRIDIGEMGHGPEWRHRVSGDRYLSTNHLMGKGYWVWLIPLSSGATSLGIVTDETVHPFSSYGRSYEQSLDWIRKHEPRLMPLIEGREYLDFHGLKNYSYHSKQVYSYRRWSCVGEAGIFLDPFYSIGGDFIAIGNTITTEMIRRDLAGELTEAAVDEFNTLVLDLLAGHGLSYYKDGYRTFGHAHIFTAKLAWDTATYWSILVPMFAQNIVRHPTPEFLDLLRRYNELHQRVERLFVEWAERVPPRKTFAHADLTRMRFHQMLYLELFARRTPEQALKVAKLNLDRLEELAQILFWKAVEECLPEQLPGTSENRPWINVWRISLDPDRWPEERLFEPVTAARSLESMRTTFAGVFGPMTFREILKVELFYRLRHIAQGKPISAFVRFFLRNFVQDKPAMWFRRLFVVDSPSAINS